MRLPVPTARRLQRDADESGQLPGLRAAQRLRPWLGKRGRRFPISWGHAFQRPHLAGRHVRQYQRRAVQHLGGTGQRCGVGRLAPPVLPATSDATRADPSNLFNCAALGLRFNCSPGTQQWFQPYANRSRVAQTVKEGAVEFDAPLLKNAPLAKSFNLNGAVRYTNYDTSGTLHDLEGGRRLAPERRGAAAVDALARYPRADPG
jgi:hypothetical protein